MARVSRLLPRPFSPAGPTHDGQPSAHSQDSGDWGSACTSTSRTSHIRDSGASWPIANASPARPLRMRTFDSAC